MTWRVSINLRTNKGLKMKTKTVINKFKKIGIEFKENDNGVLIANSETQEIRLYDQDGTVATLSTSTLATLNSDVDAHIYTDCSYRTFHDSAKSAVEWVQRYDNKAA